MYDCAIIGTGAAGVSAALTLKALNKKFLLIGNPRLSLKLRKAELVKNYPGLSSVTGGEMQSAFSAQLESEGITITNGRVTAVFPAEDGYMLACGQDVFEAKTVILCSGVESVKPIEGERELLGKGVSYCATCDGFLYRGKTIAAIISSKEEEHEVEFLSTLAKKVYLFPLYKEVGDLGANVEIIGGMPLHVEGDSRVSGVATGQGVIAVDGVFILRDSSVGDALINGLETADGAVKVDRGCATNLQGVFAAGDCTGRPYQYAKAVGEGNVAAHSVNAYLAAEKKAAEKKAVK